MFNNNEPVWADFNDRDADGAVWLGKVLTDMKLSNLEAQPKDGDTIRVSDGDVEMTGTVESREGGWVAIPDANGFRDVPKDAPYHNDNLDK